MNRRIKKKITARKGYKTFQGMYRDYILNHPHECEIVTPFVHLPIKLTPDKYKSEYKRSMKSRNRVVILVMYKWLSNRNKQILKHRRRVKPKQLFKARDMVKASRR